MILFFAIGSNLFFKPSCKTQESAPLSHVAFNERFRQSLPAEEHKTLLQKKQGSGPVPLEVDLSEC